MAQGRIKTQPGRFGLAGSVRVGRSGLSPVTSDYEAPSAFAGGVIKDVLVDVSGEPFPQMERELAAMFARE